MTYNCKIVLEIIYVIYFEARLLIIIMMMRVLRVFNGMNLFDLEWLVLFSLLF